MARIRSVHPGLWTDEEFVGLSMAARLCAIGLWNEADDYGLFEWKPVRLKMRLFPADDVDMSALLVELTGKGLVMQMARDGRAIGVIRNFRKFQRPKTPSAPIVPVDDEIIGAIGLDKAAELPNGHRNTSPALPQPLPSPDEKAPLMEDGGDKMEEEDSDADASGGEVPPPPPPIADQIWRAGVPFLESHGLTSKAARSLLGKWRKEHGDAATLSALIEAQKQGVSEPVSWIEGVFRNGGKTGQQGRTRADELWDARRRGAALAAGYRCGADGVWRSPDGSVMGDSGGEGEFAGH